MGTESDKYLILGLKSGDEISFRKAYDKYFNLIYYIAHHFELQKADAEEVVQEVFTILWEKRTKLDETLSLKAYIVKIAKNIILKRERKKIYEIAYQKYQVNRQALFSADTENAVIYSDLWEQYESIISQLSKSQREIYLLNKRQNKTVKEIAGELNLSARTVENQLYRANNFIKEKFKKLGITLALVLIFLATIAV